MTPSVLAASPGESSWNSKDAILYALGVGCGVDDLPFTTENTQGVEQQVLPTMGVVLPVGGRGAWDEVGDVNWTMLVHGEQAIELHKPIPVEGTCRSVTTVTGIYDKGSGAVVVTETESVDATDGEPLFTTRSAAFIRGEGGWGGDRGPSASERPHAPEREPDHVVNVQDRAATRRSSTGCPATATRCTPTRRSRARRDSTRRSCTACAPTASPAARCCTRCADRDPARFKSMEGRFSSPVFPGDELTVSMWVTGDGEAVFQTRRPGDVVVLDNGLCRFG